MKLSPIPPFALVAFLSGTVLAGPAYVEELVQPSHPLPFNVSSQSNLPKTQITRNEADVSFLGLSKRAAQIRCMAPCGAGNPCKYNALGQCHCVNNACVPQV